MDTQQADLLLQRNTALEQELAEHKRELEIEAALERVRSRALAMHHSDELKEVVTVVFETLQTLDFALQHAAAIICIYTQGSKDHVQWIADPGQSYAMPFNVPYHDNPLSSDIFNARESGEEFFSRLYPFEIKNEYFNFLFTNSDYRHLPDDVKKMILENRNFGFSFAFAKNSAILVPANNGTLLSITEANVLKRFAHVFDQAYVRFLDLQKAEAQTKAAQIELAMERVRTRTMTMHKSEELAEAAKLLFQQVQALGLPVLSCGYNIWQSGETVCTGWMSDSSGSISPPFRISLTETPTNIRFRESRQKGEHFYAEEVSGEALAAQYRYLLSIPNFKCIADGFEKAGFALPSYQVNNVVNFSHGNLIFITDQPAPEAWDIFKRFGKVFEQTYTRFLDLQKAEAQAREAQIELGLERVRARAMAMQTSDELSELVAILFDELIKLDLILARCIIWIFDADTLASRMWMANSEDKKIAASYLIKRIHHPYYDAIIDGWKERKAKWMYDLKGKEKKSIDALLLSETELIRLPEAVKAGILTSEETFVSGSFNNFGLIEASGPSRHSEEQLEILNRFGKVFDLCYTRFNDLKQAEAQAREARIETALERIRGRSLAMHHSNELKDVVAILFKQLKMLGLEFDGGAAIHLFSEHSKNAVILVASPDLASPIQVNLPYDEEAFVNNPIILDVWNAKETGKNIFNRIYSFEEKNKYFEYVFKHNSLEIMPQSLRYFIIQADSYTATFIAEKNSLLGASSWNRQVFSENDFDVLKRIAKAFEQAYIRFLDLQKAEAQAIRAEQDLIEIKSARKKAEDTLTELKATQTQLIQKEKMASLGELTAGIAHEIQNPLNFVNNFSDVNTELLQELKIELQADNKQEAFSLADNIIQNEQKIKHHGHRADAIVKGMLQHSRKNTGQKELTDINILADEYLRLSYHGLRAKDKDFNADFKTDFDERIGMIEVVPQDIGRVLLNLFNNAFYAVHEYLKKLGDGYKPLVTVSTKKLSDKIEIKVADNGMGISKSLVDKVFQPFFTTKPAGQGTGLGLSLSYDIIKAHGGELKVETKEEKGSEFIITLPKTLLL